MKNKILITINIIVGIIWAFNACMLDSESNVPLIVNEVCIIWGALFVYVNREYLCR